MTAIPRRQIALLAILAVAAVAVVALQMRDTPAETSQSPSNRAGPGGAQALPDVPVVDLRLERLQDERGELPESTRDPFRFRPKAPPPPPPRTASGPGSAGGAALPRPPEFAPPPTPAGPPPPPPIPVKFFGLVTIRGERVAAFTDTRGNTFYGKEGDIIEGRYQVLRIGLDSVELAYLDGRGRQTIRLTGQ
jgi:hypothetical protein